jgi:2,3,4,5-tetrahydropyridine-2-carboxylate N-succinyltransferase
MERALNPIPMPLAKPWSDDQLNTMRSLIESAWMNPDRRSEPEVLLAVEDLMTALDNGFLRTASPHSNGTWEVHEWVKMGVLLYFPAHTSQILEAGDLAFYDKVPVKSNFADLGIRVVPPAVIRYSAFVEKDCIIMPSFINVGARVGSGTMVDTWATVGSCAQVGRRVHLSGGVGIGGVLEPLQAKPVIIEDDCFVGSRCIVVEGVHLEQGVVLGAGVTLTGSSPIVDMSGSVTQILKGRVPARSVVIPGTMTKTFPSGPAQVSCALIIGQRHAGTDLKTSLNDALREYEVTV